MSQSFYLDKQHILVQNRLRVFSFLFNLFFYAYGKKKSILHYHHCSAAKFAGSSVVLIIFCLYSQSLFHALYLWQS